MIYAGIFTLALLMILAQADPIWPILTIGVAVAVKFAMFIIWIVRGMP